MEMKKWKSLSNFPQFMHPADAFLKNTKLEYDINTDTILITVI